MLVITPIINPAFHACSYVIRHPRHNNCLLVDPGNTDLTKIQDQLGGASVPYTLLTHEHLDHIAGSNALRARYGSRVVCSAACRTAMADPRKNMSAYYQPERPVCVTADATWEELGWELDWEGVRVIAMPTPGHSPGGTCIQIEDVLFTGDTLLGTKKKSPTHLPGGDKQQLNDSIHQIFARFPPQTTIYPGHGTSFLLATVSKASDER